MTVLAAAAALFLLIHFAVSGTPLRDALTARIGEGPYMGLFSLASVAALTWMGFAYGAARHGADPVWWTATPVTKWIQLGVTFVAFLLAVPGLLTPNPTSVRQETTLDRPDVAKGMVRITRHPPEKVPSATATAQVTLTHSGTPASADSSPPATSVSTITPIVFWASLVPWASATSELERIWLLR